VVRAVQFLLEVTLTCTILFRFSDTPVRRSDVFIILSLNLVSRLKKSFFSEKAELGEISDESGFVNLEVTLVCTIPFRLDQSNTL